MKRYRHYTKDKAIILSCFGSIIELDKYIELKKIIEQHFSGIDVFLSISSRMILKLLLKKGQKYKNLAQTLADVDMLGYRNILVSSINLFPTSEHEMVKNTVKGFKTFSLSNIRATNAILSKAKDTTLFLKDLNDSITQADTANLYVIHGSPMLELGGLESVSYCAKFLEFLGQNYTCSLEGEFPFFAIKDRLIKKMQKHGVKKVQVVPMLLVSGNHYLKDMAEIKEDLKVHFKFKIAPSITSDEKFNLIQLKSTTDIIINNIEEEIKKLGQ